MARFNGCAVARVQTPWAGTGLEYRLARGIIGACKHNYGAAAGVKRVC
jgi:hypothetical protein